MAARALGRSSPLHPFYLRVRVRVSADLKFVSSPSSFFCPDLDLHNRVRLTDTIVSSLGSPRCRSEGINLGNTSFILRLERQIEREE
jgi:hypothetical protein